MTPTKLRQRCTDERERLRALLADLRAEYVDAPDGSPFEQALIDAVVSTETLLEDLGTLRDNIAKRSRQRVHSEP